MPRFDQFEDGKTLQADLVWGATTLERRVRGSLASCQAKTSTD
jgi:hypothetical protein